MRRVFQNAIMSLVVLLSTVGTVTVLAPVTAQAAACSQSGTFFGLPHWYDGLQKNKTINGKTVCVVVISKDNNFRSIWTIVVNIINILLYLTGLAAVGFVIYGGIRYVISQGNPGQLTTAKQTIVRALVGLVIAVSSVFILNFLANNVLHLRVDPNNYQVSGDGS